MSVVVLDVVLVRLTCLGHCELLIMSVLVIRRMLRRRCSIRIAIPATSAGLLRISAQLSLASSSSAYSASCPLIIILLV